MASEDDSKRIKLLETSVELLIKSARLTVKRLASLEEQVEGLRVLFDKVLKLLPPSKR